MNCLHCGQVIRREADVIWVHNNGFATCRALIKLGSADATFAEPEE